jgi:hypothetical protein
MSTDTGWNDRLKKLNELLAELYPTIAESRRVVAGADLPQSFIKFNDAAIVNWFNILEAARIRGRVDALLAVAVAEFPGQERLTRLVARPENAPVGSGSRNAKLTGPLQQQFHDAMLSAFHDQTTLTQMVRYRLQENLPAIVGAGGLSQQVFDLMVWAEAHGKLEQLIEGARTAVPGNAQLKTFAEDFERWKATRL